MGTLKFILFIKKYLIHLTGLILPLFTLLSAQLLYNFSKRAILIYFIVIIIVTYTLQLIRDKKFFIIYLFFTSFLISLSSFIEISHFIIFKDAISESTIYIVLETNISEFSEFFSSYFRDSVLVFALLHIISFTVGIYYSLKTNTIQIIKKSIPLIIVLFLLLFSITYKLRSDFLPYTIYSSSITYLQQREVFNDIEILKNGNFKNIEYKEEKEEICVVIIGESTTRNHMSLYKYYRDTNPLLSKKSGLTVFKNVKTPHTHTIPALEDVLVLDNSNISNKYNSTLIQLMNSANYKTYFISNQKPIGIYETSITLMSKTSDKSYFTAISDTKLYEVILKPLDRVLAEKEKRKFILIHLMGTHLQYSKRYPTKFNIFKNIPRTKYKHETAYSTINQYDNAVLYNDFIINTIIEKVNNYDSNSYVLYFSDHGEDVYETIDEACHTESKGTAPMYNIPFIIWQSKKYINNHKSIKNKELPYNSKYLIHTIADLSQIKFTKFDKNKSIINQDYEKSN